MSAVPNVWVYKNVFPNLVWALLLAMVILASLGFYMLHSRFLSTLNDTNGTI